MNNYRKTFPYLTITGLLLFVVACNPFPTNLQPEIVEAPIIIATNPAPNQPNDLENLKIFLFEAIDKGDIKSFQETWIQLKAANPTIDLSQFTDALGNTFLHRAAEKENNSLLEFLLFHSIDKNTYVNVANYLDQTPLHIAVIHKHLGSIERLMAVDADPMVYDLEGSTPLHTAVIEGNLDIVERLTQGNNVIALIGLPTKVEGHTAIKLAYMKRHTDVLRYLMYLKYKKSDGNLAGEELLIALEHEWIDLIETLVKEKRMAVNQKGILQLAANKGCLPLVKCIVGQFRKDPNDVCYNLEKDMKNTAAYQAVRGGHPKVLYYLLQQGANPNLKKGYEKYDKPPSLLHKAIKRYIKYIKYKQVIHTQDSSTLNATNNEADEKLLDAQRNIEILLENRRSDIEPREFTIDNEYDEERYMLPYRAFYDAIKAGSKVFSLFLYHSYVPDRRKIARSGLKDYEDCEPIHIASKKGNIELVKYFLSMNADVNSICNNLKTPLMYAVESGNIETVQYLITQRATVNTGVNNLTPSCEAVKGGHEGILDLLLNNRASIENKKSDDGHTLLHVAASAKNSDTTRTQMMQYIIARTGLKGISAKDPCGYTPLHYAAQAGNQESVSTLLAVRADIHAENEEGKTPLELSMEKNNLAITKQLIAAGANLNKCLSIYDQDKILKLILFLLKNKEGTLEENIKIIDKLIRKVDKITLCKLVTNVLTANPQTVSFQEKYFYDRLIKEHNIQLTDCLASIIYDNQANYKLNSKETLSSLCRLIEWHGLSPLDCIYQLILSKKEAADQLLYHLINKYKISPLHLLNNAITQGRKDIVSLLVQPYYESTKNIIIKQCITTNDFNIIKLLGNNSLDNINCIISQATKLNKPDIIQLLITQCHLDPKAIIFSVIKEVSNPVYSADMHNFVQDLMEMNKLQTQDFAIWAAAADMFEPIKYILLHYNLTRQQLIDHAEQMNNHRAVIFLNRIVKLGNIVDILPESNTINSTAIHSFFAKRQKTNNDPS